MLRDIAKQLGANLNSALLSVIEAEWHRRVAARRAGVGGERLASPGKPAPWSRDIDAESKNVHRHADTMVVSLHRTIQRRNLLSA
jgi:hypothetical protein